MPDVGTSTTYPHVSAGAPMTDEGLTSRMLCQRARVQMTVIKEASAIAQPASVPALLVGMAPHAQRPTRGHAIRVASTGLLHTVLVNATRQPASVGALES